MPPVIAFLSRMSADYQRPYLDALRAALPGEIVAPLAELSASQREQASVAIVANPDPADVVALPGLLWIQSLWAGVESLIAALPSDSPPIMRLIDPEMSRTMAEAVLAWTYYLQRDMPRYARQQTQRVWSQHAYRKPSQTTVGLLGLGELGQAAAERLRDAGFVVHGWSRSPKTLDGVETYARESGLNAMLAASDIVISLIPLTAQTRGMLDAERLGRLKPGASLINFSRGPVIVTTALLDALDRGHLTHAVLDVFDVEPLPVDSSFWDHPRVTVLPHISAPTDHDTAAQVIADNIRDFRETGRIPSNVNLTRGY